MALLSVQSLVLAHGGPPLLDGVSFTLDRGERVSLVGRNGEGKSTLLRVLAGLETPDAGTLAFSAGTRVAMLPQDVPRDLSGSARSVVESAAGLDLHDTASMRRVDMLLSRVDVDPAAEFASFSGGQKRKVLLARALVTEPDILLLDEPTNHLDIESITWMQQTLTRFPGAVLFVTHDRVFLRDLATRILELDRGNLSDWSCGYAKYLRLREERLAAEEKQNALQDKKLAQEEVWIRQGIKARRTRNEGRVRALKALREERRARRERLGAATLSAADAGRSGRKVLEVKNLSHQWEGEPPLVRDFSTLILRGDKIGLIGPNGCGKTTLLNLLLGKIPPQSGGVIHGTKLDVLYYDQHRFQLDDNKTVFETVGEGSDTVDIQGRRRHVISWLEDFLFSPDRARVPVKVLSGGERNRLMLAKLFTRSSNVLVMDEPTNDLDIETLELLESLLVEYSGTLLLVSHDRAFLNEVVTSTLVFEGGGMLREYPGGYDDWLDQRPEAAKAKSAAAKPSAPAATPKSKRLTNWEAKELEALPAKLEEMEADLAARNAKLTDPAFYRESQASRERFQAELDNLSGQLAAAYARWEELESRTA
jgi:ATP-binding cassette subfamily F protein uup